MVSDRVVRAIAWYRENDGKIKPTLPLVFAGTTMTARSLDCLESNIAAWEAGRLPPFLAEAYVVGVVRRLYLALEAR